MHHYVPCDACDGMGCGKCDFDGVIFVPDTLPSQVRALHLLTRVFVFCLCMAAVFVMAWEFFGLWAKR